METALPNLHPAVVHLPLVLLPLAVLLDFICMFRRKDISLNIVATSLWLAGALAALGTFYAGRWAADGLVNVPPEVWPAVTTHADRAWWVVALATTGAVIRVLSWSDRIDIPARLAALTVGIGLGPMLFLTADAGGALVFQHALAVAIPEPEPCPQCQAIAPGGLTSNESRTTWTPVSGSQPFTTFEDPSGGSNVEVDGYRTELFPGEWRDVQLNAWLDLSAFDGTIELLHHVSGDDAGRFAISASTATLLARDGRVLDESEQGASATVAVALNVVGSHLKGLIEGRTVTHGHEQEAPAGPVGIRFVGSGTVILTRVEATHL